MHFSQSPTQNVARLLIVPPLVAPRALVKLLMSIRGAPLRIRCNPVQSRAFVLLRPPGADPCGLGCRWVLDKGYWVSVRVDPSEDAANVNRARVTPRRELLLPRASWLPDHFFSHLPLHFSQSPTQTVARLLIVPPLVAPHALVKLLISIQGVPLRIQVQSRAIPCVCLCCCSPQAQVLVVWDADGHLTKVSGCRSVLVLPKMPPK